MDPTLLDTIRVGQVTGSTDPHPVTPIGPPPGIPVNPWPLLVDPEGWPLLTDTGKWGAAGADLGANTEHNGRTYIFFGDVAPTRGSDIPTNADMVAWIDDPDVIFHGGHLALGWNFILPFQPTSVQGQPDWRFCGKCGSLFWDGDPNFKGFCHKDQGIHVAIGLNFVIPAAETGAHDGQPDWSFCGKCGGLFWNGDPAFHGVCPKDGQPHFAIGWNFYLPFVTDVYIPTGRPEQADWRFCGKCGGLFWHGGYHMGICIGAPGGGLRLNPVVTDNGLFAPFTGTDPVGMTLSLETPNGAFSYANKVWVFAGFSDPQFSGHVRPGDPQAGCYLTSNVQPDRPGLYQTEFLFSPRIGWCPHDSTRDRLESHSPLGWKFYLAHGISEDATHQGQYRRCRKCATLFFDGDPAFKGVCHRGESHERSEPNYVLTHSRAEDSQNQASWRQCSKCASVFWAGAQDNGGLCPAGGEHQVTTLDLLLSHPSFQEDGTHQGNWRFCGKCAGLFWDGDFKFKGLCPKDGAGHSPIGFNFMLPHDVPEDTQHQQQWRFCGKCGGLFWNGQDPNTGVCPRDGAGHSAIGINFVLPHGFPEDTFNQTNWRFCGKCFGLFWDGDPNFKGTCPQDGAGHVSIGDNFVLAHNPGEDVFTEGGWRFCTRCHGAVFTRWEDRFSWVAPCVIETAQHPGLPQTPFEQGLVMFGFSYSGDPGIRLAWMPLKTSATPRLEDILYYTGLAENPWSPEETAAVVLFKHTNTYTHLSATWVADAQRWVLLYSLANDETGVAGEHLPVVTRIGTSLLEWSEEIEIFNPGTQRAYGRYMHQVGVDRIHPDIPPTQNPSLPEHDGWAYGAFLLTHYTKWDPAARELTIFYLMSLSSPYHVQLMRSRFVVP
jgi:hypothetical protein